MRARGRIFVWMAALLAVFVLSGCVRAQSPRHKYIPPVIEGWTYAEIEKNQELVFSGPQGITQTVKLAEWCTPVQSSCLKGSPELTTEAYVQPREAVWDGPSGFKVQMFWPPAGVLGIYYQGEGWSLQEPAPEPTPSPTTEPTPDPEGQFFSQGVMAACTKGSVTQRLWVLLGTSTGNPLVGNPPLDNQGKKNDESAQTAQNGAISIYRVSRYIGDILTPGFRVKGDGWSCVEEAQPQTGP